MPHRTSRSSRAKTDGLPAGSEADATTRRWLLLVHQLPSHPSNLRVRTWRRMRQLGAVALKQAVYVLPDSPGAREDFEWLRAEIDGAGGAAFVFQAEALAPAAEAALVADFQRASQHAYRRLVAEMRRARPTRASGVERPLRRGNGFDRFRQRLAAIERVDVFGAPGRERAVSLLASLEARSPTSRAGGGAPARGADVQDYRARVWITRPRPGVDRMASAWLIRRFVDPQARFEFVADPKTAPAGSVPFDMYGVELTHHGAHCTFETLCERFGIRDPGVDRLAMIVHDLDLRDERFGAPEASTIGAAIEGLQLACPDDAALLEQGVTLFEALYRSFSRTGRIAPSAPRRRRSRPRRAR